MNKLIKIIKNSLSILLIGIVGALFCQTKAGAYLEEEIGLDWLFRLRGTLPPPADVIIVSIDQASAEILQLPEEPEKWSRTFYTSLIEQLTQQKPVLIAFNIHFGDSREPKIDNALAKAITKSKNIILGDLVRQPSVSGSLKKNETPDVRVVKSIPVLSDAALDTAPFLLPKTSSTVKEYWARFSSDQPTFPVSIFQYFVIKAVYPEAKQLLSQIDETAFGTLPNSFENFSKESPTLVQDIQTALAISPDLVRQQLADPQYLPMVKKLFQSWLELLSDRERFYLNYYGDVGAITTVPFYQALTANLVKPNLFKDKIVLVGYADNLEPEKQQGLYSAFSRANGHAISPTEIAATAVANLLDQSWLKQISIQEQALLILVWGVLLSILFRLFPFNSASILMISLVIIYVVINRYLFKTESIWLPLVIPLLQAMTIFLWEATTYFNKVRTVSRRYLPKEVFAINTQYPEAMDKYGVLMQGVCMATDAGQYTSLSEALSPLQINKLMNDYYGTIFPKVKNRGGLISDVIGDAMLAVWAAEKQGIKLRRNACLAALEIKSAVDSFNNTSEHHLHTRIGLHFGEMRLGNIGAMEHYEYRAIGDTVNTTTRIEDLNKLLGTRILVSSLVINDLPEFISREIGTFLLKGKSLPITVFQLLANNYETISPAQRALMAKFALALDYYKKHQWEQALLEFDDIHKAYPDDIPTLFYIKYLKNRPGFLLKDDSKKDATIIDMSNITVLLHNVA